MESGVAMRIISVLFFFLALSLPACQPQEPGDEAAPDESPAATSEEPVAQVEAPIAAAGSGESAKNEPPPEPVAPKVAQRPA